MNTHKKWINYNDRAPNASDLPFIRIITKTGEIAAQNGFCEIYGRDYEWWLPVEIPPVPPKAETQTELDEKFIQGLKIFGPSWSPQEAMRTGAKAGIDYERAEIARIIDQCLRWEAGEDLVDKSIGDRLMTLRKIQERVTGGTK